MARGTAALKSFKPASPPPAGGAPCGRERTPISRSSRSSGRPRRWRLTPGLAQLLDLGERRRELASLFSWAIPTDAALDVFDRYAPLVECGAGMGYWTALLRARGSMRSPTTCSARGKAESSITGAAAGRGLRFNAFLG